MSDTADPFAAAAEPLQPLAPQTPRRGRRGLLIGGAVAAVAVAGAGAYAVASFLGGGADVADAIPGGALGYVSFDLDPGGKQQLEAYQTLKKFPSLDELMDQNAGENLREQLFTWLDTEAGCEDVDFAQDVAPWVGTTAAVSVVSGGDAEPKPFLVVEVSDEKAAEAGLKKLSTCGSEDAGWVIEDGWATVAESEEEAQQIAEEAASGPLADSAEYTNWLDELGEQGVMTFYVSADAAQELAALAPEMSQLQQAQIDEFAGMAGTLRFADEGIEFASVTNVSQRAKELLSDGAGQGVEALPDDTLAAMSLSVGPEMVDWLLELAQNEDIPVGDLEQQLGLDLPDDVAVLLGDSVTLSVGGALDVDALANSGDPADLPAAITIKGDSEKIEAVLEKLVARDPSAAEMVAWESTGNTVVIGPSADYRSQLLDGDGGLASTKSFSSVVPDSTGTAMVFYLDFNGADDWLYRLAEEADPTVAENVKPLAGIGMSSSVDGDIGRSLLRITTD